VVVPYSTWESLASLVVHAIVATVAPTAEAPTPEMTGGVTSGVSEYVTRRNGRSPGLGSSMLAKYR
jgi:hypothetical protein